MPDLITPARDLQEAHEVQVRRLQLVIAALVLLVVAGWVGWRVAGREQAKAQTNAQVAQAGATLADQLEAICKSDDAKVKAYVKKYGLCDQARDVVQAAKSIDATLPPSVPVQTVTVPGARVTNLERIIEPVAPSATNPLGGERFLPLPGATVTVTATQTVPGAQATQVVSTPGPERTITIPGPAGTVTMTVPGPQVTQTVTAPGPTITETVTAPGPEVTTTVPGPATTVTSTETVPGPVSTETITVPGPEVTITVTVTGAPVEPPVTETVIDPPTTDVVTETVAP